MATPPLHAAGGSDSDEWLANLQQGGERAAGLVNTDSAAVTLTRPCSVAERQEQRAAPVRAEPEPEPEREREPERSPRGRQGDPRRARQPLGPARRGAGTMRTG
jgi:hypothetical protein